MANVTKTELRMRPVLVGTFPELCDAETARELFEVASRNRDDENSPANTLTIPAPFPARREISLHKPPREKMPESIDLIAAFARIRNGEKIVVVAADIGISLNSLRARWANHNRGQTAVIAVATNMKPGFPAAEKEQCSLCSREFTPSMSSPDKCARCAGEFK